MEREEGAWNEVKSREREEIRGHMEREKVHAEGGGCMQKEEGAWRGRRAHGEGGGCM